MVAASYSLVVPIVSKVAGKIKSYGQLIFVAD
jgi:hypothetical protein